jgi:hypothetical protein
MNIVLIIVFLTGMAIERPKPPEDLKPVNLSDKEIDEMFEKIDKGE